MSALHCTRARLQMHCEANPVAHCKYTVGREIQPRLILKYRGIDSSDVTSV